MKKILFLLSLLIWNLHVYAGNSACLPSLTGFICKDSNQKVMLNRCATNRGCYELNEAGQKLQCCPAAAATDAAKKSFMALVKSSNSKNLDQFKLSCDFSSPIDFVGDKEARDATQDVIKLGEVHSVRALIYAESHCVNIHSHETILSWLGNEILIAHPATLIQAFSDEDKNMHLTEIAQMETNEWRKLKCKKDPCRLNRNSYFASKLTALQNAKVPSSLESTRQEILQSLKSVTNSGRQSFLKLAKEPSDKHLNEFKEKCSISNPVDFVYDSEVHQVVENLFKEGKLQLIRALMHAEPYCTDIENRKTILSWLGNEILIAHPAMLLKALQYEDKKHELYDIVEVENKEWRETKCSGDPCAANRKAYFASKRKALTEANIEKPLEPYRRMLLKALVSDQ